MLSGKAWMAEEEAGSAFEIAARNGAFNGGSLASAAGEDAAEPGNGKLGVGGRKKDHPR